VRLKTAAIVAVTLLLWGNGVSPAEQITQDAIQQVAEKLPVLSPDLIWHQDLPGLRRTEPRNPHAPVAKELAGAMQTLSAGWSAWAPGEHSLADDPKALVSYRDDAELQSESGSYPEGQ
jgi:hypothetical protein